MTPQQLDEGFKWSFKETFKMNNILHRTSNSGPFWYVSLMGNLAYKLYIKKLYKEKNRFPVGLDMDGLMKKHESSACGEFELSA